MSQKTDLREVIINTNTSGLPVDPEKLEQYMKALAATGNDKENPEKLAAMWMYAGQMTASRPASSLSKRTPPPTNSRPIMLIPAGNGSTTHLASPQLPPGGGVYMSPAPMLAPPYRGGVATLPYMRAPPQMLYPHTVSMPGTYRTQKSSRSGINQQRRRKRAAAAAGAAALHAQHLRSGKMEANRRQRRKSEADVLEGQENFQYHGLDRLVADTFLARQEQSNAGSHLDCSSASSASGTYGKMGKEKTAGAASTAKIICREVVM